MKHKLFLIFFIIPILGILLVAGCNSAKTNDSITGGSVIENPGSDKVTLYKSSSCGCCSLYSNYLKNNGKFKLDIINLEAISSVKEKYKIPYRLESCHTTVIGNYFVEGHIPLEAINKLMSEKPDIAGIAMPGMPSGAPGMPGAKDGQFIVYAVNKDGTSYEFMRL